MINRLNDKQIADIYLISRYRDIVTASRVRKKTNKYCINYINQVLNPEREEWNDLIVNAALSILKKHRDTVKEDKQLSKIK